MNDAFLVRMLDGLADLPKQPETFFEWQPMLVAEFGQRRPSTNSITK